MTHTDITLTVPQIQLTNEGTGKAVINSAKENSKPIRNVETNLLKGCKTDFYNSDGSQLNVGSTHTHTHQKQLTANNFIYRHALYQYCTH